MRMKGVRPELYTVLEVSRRNLRFPKNKYAKPRMKRYVPVALKFKHSNLEMIFRVM